MRTPHNHTPIQVTLEPVHHGFPSLALLLYVPDRSTSTLSSCLTLTGAEAIVTYPWSLDSPRSCTHTVTILERHPFGCNKGE